jgi:hypothetical protein
VSASTASTAQARKTEMARPSAWPLTATASSLPA